MQELKTTKTDTNDFPLRFEAAYIKLTEELAVQFKEKRELRGWSQTVMAERSPVSRRMIVEIEGAKRNPELKTLLALAMTLGYGIRVEFTRLD